MTYSQEDLILRDGPASSDGSFNEDDLADHVRELVLEDPQKLKGYKPMRVVMVQTAMGLKPPSGGFRGNYATLFALQKHGHQTMQFCWAQEKDILHAAAELKAKGVWYDGCIEHDIASMLNDDEEVVEVNWWKFRNVHGVLCICLDADIMRYIYNNYVQQLDAAEWIEVSNSLFKSTLADFSRQMNDQPEPSCTQSGSSVTSKCSTQPTSSSTMLLPALSPPR